ncbi:unnamed protein product [Urochloa humidicola]
MEEDDGAAPELGPSSPPPPTLPSYPEMILEAIDALGNANGSNKTAISGYLKDKYRADLPKDHNSLLTINLGRMKSSGELVFSKNNYFRPEGDEEEEEKEVKEGEPSATAAADKPASPLLLEVYKDPSAAEDYEPAFGYLDLEDDGLLAPPPVLDDDADGVPDPAPGVAADEIAAPAPAPGVATDDIEVPDPASDVNAEAVAGPVKRGRGRPPKPKDDVAEGSSAAAAETSLVAPDAIAPPAMRGRGRPPKPKDPVGEESSGVPAETSFVAADTVAPPAKRGRGRPPKLKDPVAEASIGATDDAADVPAKRGRGRPPKPKDPAAMGTSGEPTAEEAPVTAADADAPVKRGRGRPPKPKDPVDETISRATSGMLSPRGQPPKKTKVEEAPIDAPAGSAPGTSAPVKRGRGRPPKVRD